MKHSIECRLFESYKEDIEFICKKYGIKNWTLNKDGSIDIDGDVYLHNKGLNKLPLKFRNVDGDFDCSFNDLISLEGCPKYVGRNFNCSFNNLTSLEGCPELVNNSFYCFNCSKDNLTSLKGCPKSVGGNFNCSYNNLTSLEGSPKSVSGDFWCSNNNLTSLEGAPESIGVQFYCRDNSVYQIWNLFKDKDKIEFFNDLDIIRGNLIIFDRLIYFLDTIGKPRTKEELRNLIKYYTFV
jgi:hypothetical protein